MNKDSSYISLLKGSYLFFAFVAVIDALLQFGLVWLFNYDAGNEPSAEELFLGWVLFPGIVLLYTCYFFLQYILCVLFAIRLFHLKSYASENLPYTLGAALPFAIMIYYKIYFLVLLGTNGFAVPDSPFRYFGLITDLMIEQEH